MNRQQFVARSAAALSAAALPLPAFAAGNPFDPKPGAWHTYEVTTEVTLAQGKAAHAWVPVPAFDEPDWMRPGKSVWTGDADTASLESVGTPAASFVHAQWREGTRPRKLSVVSLVSTRDRAVDVNAKSAAPALSDADRELYTSATQFIPTTGIVKETSEKITAGATGDVDKARRIYEWVVQNTYRNPKTRGCGLGNVAFLLESGDFGGKCADINGLAVGLFRSAGLPARDLYGIRVAPSKFGYKSLGANSSAITKAQHCRAEVYLDRSGWTPVDPADVRKVMLEEPPGNLSPSSAKVVDARQTLFGAWEGNYMAYNDARDVALPGSNGPALAFLMYPQAEIGGERLDSLDAASFVYEITVKQVG